MATASNVVVCDVLCFLRHKFGKTAAKVTKSLLINFYYVEVSRYRPGFPGQRTFGGKPFGGKNDVSYPS